MMKGSLARKCLTLFGAAIVLIVIGALVFPWLRMTALVDAGQLELSRALASAWSEAAHAESEAAHVESEAAQARTQAARGGAEPGRNVELVGITARRLTPTMASEGGRDDPFLARAMHALTADPARTDYQEARWNRFEREYRFARAERAGDAALSGLLVLDRRSLQASQWLVGNTTYLLWAGLIVIALALPVFYFITRKLVLRPVRRLTQTAEMVRRGDPEARAELHTGDEFEQLAETFNSMLGDLKTSEDRLRAINAALDSRLTELAQSNTALYESAKMKGEFLASVSHELRTPLNSIIGFAELLMELARADTAASEASGEVLKRVRYLENILTAGRNLLALINSLLELARIEAGKVELRAEPMALREACEAMVGLIYPQAERKGVEVKSDLAEDLPLVITDVKKFQQIIFNFLSNAVKFTEAREKTGRAGMVALRAERLFGGAPGSPDEKVRVSVIDNGPGIPKEEQERIFEKFYQLDQGHTRGHAGTGLGLAICKELAAILHADIQVESEVGRGSMFSLIMPLSIEREAAAETKLEAKFRAALAGRGEFEA